MVSERTRLEMETGRNRLAALRREEQLHALGADTSWEDGGGIAVVTVRKDRLRTSPEDIVFREPTKEWPSEHMLAQIMLVAG